MKQLRIHPDLARELGPAVTRAVLALSARLVVANVAGQAEGGEVQTTLDKRELRAVRTSRGRAGGPGSAVVAMAASEALKIAGLASKDRPEDVLEALDCRQPGSGRPAEAVSAAARIATRAVTMHWAQIQTVAESIAADLRRTNAPLGEIDADLVDAIVRHDAGGGRRERAALDW